jgi:uncharacterized membrane protein
MDLAPFLTWFKLIHVVGAFLFVAGHGVSMAVAFRLRQERDGGRMLALLDLSASSLNLATAGLLIVLIAGIVGGIDGGYFGRAWIWLSLVLLIVVSVLMTPIIGLHFAQIRRGLGQRTRNLKPADPDPVPLPFDEVAMLAASRRPESAALVGGTGFLVIVWLMTFKPF